MKTGKAVIKGNKMYFDAVGWDLLIKVAKKQKRSPKTIITKALWRLYREKEVQGK